VCLEYGDQLIQINGRLVDNHIDDGQMAMITSETKRKCDELVKDIQVNTFSFFFLHQLEVSYQLL